MGWLDINAQGAAIGTNGATSGVSNSNPIATGSASTVTGMQLPTDPKIWAIIAVGALLGVKTWKGKS